MKKKEYRELGGVLKRCRHSEAEQELCPCPWFYMVTVKGKRHRGKIPSVSNETDARTAFQLIAARVRNGLPPFEEAPKTEEPTTGVTVEQLGDDWLSMRRKRKASVLNGYRDHLRAHINPKLGHLLVTSVKPEQCEQFVQGLARRKSDKPLSIGTKMNIARTLTALFSFGVDRRLRSDNPAKKLASALIDPDTNPDNVKLDPNDHTKYFTAEEARHLLAVCRAKFPDWHPFVLTGLATGMRVGELRALNYEQINWRSRTIMVDRAWVDGVATTPKNGKTRNVTMTTELHDVLYLRWKRLKKAELVFPSRVGTPLEVSRLRRFWKELLEEAKLGYRVMHAMRHTHTSLLLQAGHTAEQVSAEAGRSVQMTMAVYAHWAPETSAPNVERLGEMLSGSKDTRVSRQGTSGHQRQRKATKLRIA